MKLQKGMVEKMVVIDRYIQVLYFEFTLNDVLNETE